MNSRLVKLVSLLYRYNRNPTNALEKWSRRKVFAEDEELLKKEFGEALEKPWKRKTWNLTIQPSERNIIFQIIIFRFYVKLWGCLHLMLWTTLVGRFLMSYLELWIEYKFFDTLPHVAGRLYFLRADKTRCLQKVFTSHALQASSLRPLQCSSR